jgi:hypothetical protein
MDYRADLASIFATRRSAAGASRGSIDNIHRTSMEKTGDAIAQPPVSKLKPYLFQGESLQPNPATHYTATSFLVAVRIPPPDSSFKHVRLMGPEKKRRDVRYVRLRVFHRTPLPRLPGGCNVNRPSHREAG